jgi:hypothetical protein
MPDSVGELARVAYTDETQHDIGRFRGIGLLACAVLKHCQKEYNKNIIAEAI